MGALLNPRAFLQRYWLGQWVSVYMSWTSNFLKAYLFKSKKEIYLNLKKKRRPRRRLLRDRLPVCLARNIRAFADAYGRTIFSFRSEVAGFWVWSGKSLAGRGRNEEEEEKKRMKKLHTK